MWASSKIVVIFSRADVQNQKTSLYFLKEKRDRVWSFWLSDSPF